MDSALGPIRRSFVQQARAYRRYWVKPGRSRAWWDNFLSDAVLEEEWKDNFRVCKTNFLQAVGELRPFIEKNSPLLCVHL